MAMGPFVLTPLLKERIWGVETLPAMYPQPLPGQAVGEVWLTAEECVVAGGGLAGRTLADLAAASPDVLASAQGFPLLLKMLMPREKLSVQVHPNDVEARLLGQQRGKTECWYVLEAEPGATLAVGLREEFGPADLIAAIADGTLESKMKILPVKAGDMIFVDAGTVHAIGPGMVVLETQQYSDVTYRLFDYGRPRELHVAQGVAVTKHSLRSGLVAAVAGERFTRLITSEYFIVDRIELGAQDSVPLGETSSLQILVALDAACVVSGGGAEVELPQGHAVVLPAEGIEYEVLGDAGTVVMRVLAA